MKSVGIVLGLVLLSACGQGPSGSSAPMPVAYDDGVPVYADATPTPSELDFSGLSPEEIDELMDLMPPGEEACVCTERGEYEGD